jgi:pimeloyl-ACP methyl ester carboxylesterase
MYLRSPATIGDASNSHGDRRIVMSFKPALIAVVFGALLPVTINAQGVEGSGLISKSDTLVDIGTHKLRVVVSDIESEYTVVLEAGGGKDSDSYQKIQDTLAQLTGARVVSYDRSGFGQSELGPDQFDAGDEVDALKRCLEALDIEGKLILVGLSYGGFLVQLFTHQYPELVSGAVLIDPMNVKFVDRFGLDNLNAVTPYFDPPTNDREKAGNRMVDSFTGSLQLLRGKELPADIPIILLTSGNPPFSSDIWRQCHEELVGNGDKHELRIAEGCNHDILEEDPQLVLKTVVELAARVKAK